MTRRKLGLSLFWVGAIWAFVWGVVVSVKLDTMMNTMTMEELNQTAWAFTGGWYLTWAYALPVGGLMAGLGALVLAGARGSKVWMTGIGVVVAIFVGMAPMVFGHHPPLFGIGGTLIFLFFLGSLWFWANERRALEGSSAKAADLKVVAYVFFLLAAWFICGALGQPFLGALEELPTMSPVHIMLYLVLGWLFLFLSHFYSGREGPSAGA